MLILPLPVFLLDINDSIAGDPQQFCSGPPIAVAAAADLVAPLRASSSTRNGDSGAVL